LIECKTYRQKGHSRVDSAKYRPREEVEEWLRRDPIRRLRDKLIQAGISTEAEVQEIEKRVSNEIEDAVKFAVESTGPSPEEALEDVYA
jgi:pyruvate dehydrogenase E1 component alpha subunit